MNNTTSFIHAEKFFFLLSFKNEKTFSDEKSNKRHDWTFDRFYKETTTQEKEIKKGDEKRDEKKLRSFFALL